MEPKRGTNYFANIANKLAEGAERAREAGDINAMIHLAVVSAQYIQLAKLSEPISRPSSHGGDA